MVRLFDCSVSAAELRVVEMNEASPVNESLWKQHLTDLEAARTRPSDALAGLERFIGNRRLQIGAGVPAPIGMLRPCGRI